MLKVVRVFEGLNDLRDQVQRHEALCMTSRKYSLLTAFMAAFVIWKLPQPLWDTCAYRLAFALSAVSMLVDHLLLGVQEP